MTSWKAQMWSGGGVTAIYLHDPADAATREQVHTILTKLAGDPANGVDRVLDEGEVRKYGGFPGAAYLIVMKQGYTAGGATSGPLVVAQSALHGRSWVLAGVSGDALVVFVMGQGVARGRDLGDDRYAADCSYGGGHLGVSLPFG